jgi:hypothetical protein
MNEITDNIPAGTVLLLTYYEETTPTFVLPFTAFDAATKYLLEEFGNWEDDLEILSYQIRKMIPATDGNMQTVITWQLNREGVIVNAQLGASNFESYKVYYADKKSADVFTAYTYFGRVLSLRTPYQVGDIIIVDQRPVRKLSHAVIAKIGDESDANGTMVVHTRDNGRLVTSPLPWYLMSPSMRPDHPGLHRLAKLTR